MNKLLSLVFAFCLTAGSAMAATEGRPVFISVSKDAKAFEEMLTAQGSLKDGQVSIEQIGAGLHPWAEPKGVLSDSAKDATVFANELVKVYGQTMPYAQFLQLVQKGEFKLPPSVLKQEVVAATASATPAPASAPTGVITAAAPAPQFAPSVSQTDRDKLQQQLSEQNGRIEAQAKVLDELHGQLQQVLADDKSTEEEKQQIAALSGEVVKLQKQLVEQDQKSAKLVMASGETLSVAQTQLQQEIAKVSVAVATVLGRVSAVEKDVQGIKASPIIRFGTEVLAFVAVVLLLLAGLCVIALRRGNKAKADAATAVKIGVTTQSDLDAVKAEVGVVAEHVEAVADSVGYKKKVFSFDDDVLKSDLKCTAVGGVMPFRFLVDHKPCKLKFTRVDDGHVRITGIRGQTESVRIDNVAARIKRAANKGDLVGVDDDKLPVLHDALAA